MVELVGAGMVEVLALEVNLAAARAHHAAEALAVVDGRGAPLELAANAAQFVNELRGVGDGFDKPVQSP